MPKCGAKFIANGVVSLRGGSASDRACSARDGDGAASIVLAAVAETMNSRRFMIDFRPVFTAPW